MKKTAYSIFDSAISCYLGMQLFQNDDEAKRACVDLMSGQPNNITSHPDDFTLMRIGTFDDASGELKPADHIESVRS